MLQIIREPARAVPVAGAYDVLVAGGGIAGVAAAVAARRQGASVCLVEKTAGLGGLATLGNVTVWLPICNGFGRQVIGGIGEELLRLSVGDLKKPNSAAGFHGIPPCWEPGGDPQERRRQRFYASFNPSAYLFALERWVADAGVTLLYDTACCALKRRGPRLTHALIENKSGRQALAAQTFIDATGDADLCHLAGEATESLDSNVLCGWFYYLEDGTLHSHKWTNAFSPDLTREGGTGPFFRGDDGRQVTDLVLGSRELIRRRLDDLRVRHPDADIQLFAPPSIACFRATRRLVGRITLLDEHVHQWFDDTCGLTGDWRKPGPVWAIPWRSLCAVGTRNLAAAGRCISAAGSAWDVTRAIPGCAATGEAAGTAAALACQRTRGDLHRLETAEIQAALHRRGALLDAALVAPPEA